MKKSLKKSPSERQYDAVSGRYSAVPRQDKGTFWILWNPKHHLPPVYRFYNFKAAQKRAVEMAELFGHPFYVMEAKTLAACPKTKAKVTKIK